MEGTRERRRMPVSEIDGDIDELEVPSSQQLQGHLKPNLFDQIPVTKSPLGQLTLQRSNRPVWSDSDERDKFTYVGFWLRLLKNSE